jgi:hypothetical protein
MVDGKSQAIIGKDLIVTREPALHPGDVQLAEGVMPSSDSPQLALSKCVCFRQKGAKDLPSKLSGGDLDGDPYYIMWDKNCRPQRYLAPADYPRQKPDELDRPVERDDMTNFFLKFMETDQLGRIAVLQRFLVDQEVLDTSDPKCIILAEIHSTAVGFSKTGIRSNIHSAFVNPSIADIRTFRWIYQGYRNTIPGTPTLKPQVHM